MPLPAPALSDRSCVCSKGIVRVVTVVQGSHTNQTKWKGGCGREPYWEGRRRHRAPHFSSGTYTRWEKGCCLYPHVISKSLDFRKPIVGWTNLNHRGSVLHKLCSVAIWKFIGTESVKHRTSRFSWIWVPSCVKGVCTSSSQERAKAAHWRRSKSVDCSVAKTCMCAHASKLMEILVWNYCICASQYIPHICFPEVVTFSTQILD